MTDQEFLAEQIAKAKTINEELEADIAKMGSNGRDLDALLEELRHERDRSSRNIAHLMGLSRDQEETKREIAKLQGVEYRDPYDPDYEYQEPPDDEQ